MFRRMSNGLLILCFFLLGGLPTQAQDAYEPDDTSTLATTYYIGSGAQAHTIHTATDEDWIVFNAIEALTYTITAGDPGTDLDLALEIYAATDLVTPLSSVDDEVAGVAEDPTWIAPDQGPYYVRVLNAGSGALSDPGYTLSIVEDTAVTNGHAETVSDTELQLSWTPAPGRTVLGYRVERGLNVSGPYQLAANVLGSTTEHLDFGLSPDTTYYYIIFEYDTSWNSGQLTSPFSGKTELSGIEEWLYY